MKFDIDITIVAIYLIITLIVGIWKGRNIKSMQEYAVADRNYPVPILVATIAATWYGGGDTIGVAEKSFSLGIIVILLSMLNSVPKFFIGSLIAPRMKHFKNAISAGDIMGNLYGTSAKVITGVAGLGLSMGYIGAQIASLGYVLNCFFGIDPLIGIYVSAGIVIIYSAFGGIKSVTATDVIQFGAIVVVIPQMAVIAFNKVGGFQGLINNIEPSKLDFFPDYMTNFDLIFTILVYITPFLNPAMVQRLLLAKNSKDMAKSFKISALIDLAFYFMVGIIGLSALALNSALEPSEAFFYIISETLPIGIKGLAIVGLLAVIMSTADSYLNVASISLVHDIITPFNKNITDKTLLGLSKLMSVLIGLGGIWMATAHDSIFDIVHTALDFWGPIVVAPLILGILGFIASSRTFFISGFIAILTYFVLKSITTTNPLGLSTALIPSMFINAFIFLCLYYLFDKKNKNIHADR
jgi:solute:Na+ symporter, SSS family